MSAQPRGPDATPRNQQAQPLPPDPIGREDIMSPQPRADAAPRNQQAQPLPLDADARAWEESIEEQPSP